MRQIYLDYNATTPIAAPVREAMQPFLEDFYGNPSSTHAMGRTAHAAIDDSRKHVADLIGADPSEVVFTSGGTESNNLAIQGTILSYLPDLTGHLVISALEHPATTAPADHLKRFGVEVSVVTADEHGWIDPGKIAAAMRRDTRLVSIMHANNEIGTVQSIGEISEICRQREVLLHTDAAQSIGKLDVFVDTLGVDLLSIAGHKFYAPKGVGALYIRTGVALEPVVHGAGHERGLRPGTENTLHLVGIGRAARLASEAAPVARDRMALLRDRLLSQLQHQIGDELTVNGSQVERLPNTLSANFPGVIGGDLLEAIPELCASTGSACHSGETKLSATLAAIGLKPEIARGTIRLSVGWYTTEEEVDRAAELLVDAWERLRQR